MQTANRLYCFFALALFALLISFQIHKLQTTALSFDDAYFANVAKNLAFGRGYSSVYFDRLYPFHWNNSAGPVIIVPAALVIWICGNTHWAPGLTIVIEIALLLLFLLQLLKHVSPAAAWQCAAFFLSAALLITNHGINTPEHMLVWYALLGEAPSALFVIAAILCIARKRDDARTVFVGGMLIGLGIACKILALMGGGALGIYLAASYILQEKPRKVHWQQAFKCLALYGIGALLPLMLFEMAKLCILGAGQYWITLRSLFGWMHGYNNPQDGGAHSLGKLYVIGQYFGIFPEYRVTPSRIQMFCLAMVVTGFPAALFYYFVRFRNRLMRISPLGWAAGALLFAAFAHSVWYVLINSVGLARYMMQGMFYLCAGLALLVGQLTMLDARRGRAIFILSIMVMLWARADAAIYLLPVAPDSMLEDQQRAFQVLSTLKQEDPGTLIFSCGNALELEYLLPTSGNFILCDKMFEPEFAHHKHIFLIFSWLEKDKVLRLLLNSGQVLLFSNPDIIVDACPKADLYAGTYYTIASCNK